jgi:hypothetical protein
MILSRQGFKEMISTLSCNPCMPFHLKTKNKKQLKIILLITLYTCFTEDRIRNGRIEHLVR